MKRTTLFLLCLATLWLPLSAQTRKPSSSQPSPQAQANKERMNRWVDSVMTTFTLDDKVGQLIMLRVPLSTLKSKDIKAFEQALKRYRVGGICFFKGTTAEQLSRTLRYQRMASFPLMVAIDGEWGLGMRLTDSYAFPYLMMAGALAPKHDTLISQMAKEVALQCKAMGIHVDFAPVADLNSNPLNPVIGARSMGENKKRVADKAVLYAKAMQQQGVLAVGKHFPGHGDTDVDSHSGVPVIHHSKAYIDSVDLYPFQRMVTAGVRGMMVGHIQVPALDNAISSTSEKVVSQLLRKQMKFNGLIFTDGMDMGAITQTYAKGEGELKALLAGVDIVLLPGDVEATVKSVKQRALSDTAFARQIDLKCRRILQEKYRMGIPSMQLGQLSIPTQKDYARCDRIAQNMALRAATLVRNEGGVLPLGKGEKVACFAIGNCDTAITSITDAVALRLASADKVVLHLHARLVLTKEKNYGFTTADQDLVRQIVAFNPKTVVVIYGSPYSLRFLQPSKAPISQLPAAIVVAYQDVEVAHKAMESLLWGKASFEGVLPVSVGDYKEGLSLSGKGRGKKGASRYAAVQKAGMDTLCFRKIDSIAQMGIDRKAYPGCQLLVARKGKVVYHQCYGAHTYDKGARKVDTNTMYDLASVTKVMATTLAVMRLVDAGKVSLDDPLSRYVPSLKHSNKKKITIRQCLSHCARLKAFDGYYQNVPSACGDLSLGSDAVECDDCREGMLEQIADSKLNKGEGYVYSDLGFILLAEMVRMVSGQSIDVYAAKHFYQPMGLKNTTFCPRLHGFDTARIAPTERDTYYRQRLLQGEVQDQNASAFGGVAGHAGLFATASDLNQICQMLLAGGTWKGHRYLSSEVVDLFNQRHYAHKGNRRALGFDKPLIQGESTHVAPQASQRSFGHTGYTGTMIWVDPQYDLVFIFLSNRVHPSSDNNLLSKLDIRTDIQSLIYQSIK